MNKEITAISRDFESIRQIAKEFCASVNVSLDEIDLEIDAVLPKKRARKKIEFLPNACHVSSEEFEIVGSGQEESEDGGDQEGNDVSTCKENGKTCKSCFTCAYKVLHHAV